MTDHSPRKISSTLVGAAGESYVLFELYRRGILAGQPPQGVADVDLLVLDERASVVTNLQVKTRMSGSNKGWHMKEKHESLISDRLMYVFVDLEPSRPISYVVPSAVVAEIVKKSHAAWLANVGKSGRQRRDTVMRWVLPCYKDPVPGFEDGWLDKYRERWDLLANQLT